MAVTNFRNVVAFAWPFFMTASELKCIEYKMSKKSPIENKQLTDASFSNLHGADIIPLGVDLQRGTGY